MDTDQESQSQTQKVCIPNKERTESEIQAILTRQSSRSLSQFEVTKLEKEAKKNWDKFYKRNETKFFKDRQWTLREFDELRLKCEMNTENEAVTLLEVGCGVGNFAFPLLQELSTNLRIFACDFSPRAIEFMKSKPEYDESKIRGFVADVTVADCFQIPELSSTQMDFASLIFVLSSISPDKHSQVIRNILDATKIGGIVFFRDYGRYDMAQLRFKPGRKIDENFYARHDGTRSYYFTPEEVEAVFTKDGHFETLQCDYLHRRTINVKEGVDVERIFVQGKFIRR
jgi:methyltransferase-like protein 6